MPAKTTTKGGETRASARPLSPHQNSHGNPRNSPPLEDVHMRAVDGEEGAEGVDLITKMLSPEAYERYVATFILPSGGLRD